ncbi:MAG: MFS transporter, partial [Candidatus Eremiobacteraeota bacterium]|nr:MFS transporter [Candidatus Eremiobacteraeota bacterium]
AAVIDLGFFGGVTAGPLLGGALGEIGAWRPLFWALAALALAVFVTAALTLPSKDPFNPGIRFDRQGVALAFVGTLLPFWAVAELTGKSFGSVWFIAPFVLGGLAFIALILAEFYEKEPISPVKPMWNTLPVVGVIIAMVGGSAYFTLFVLAQQFLVMVQHRSLLQSGLLFWPQVAGALAASIALGFVLRTRFLTLYALAGMLCILGGGALVVTMTESGSIGFFLPSALLLGFGAGATVAPGLWFASLSLQSKMVGRIFALVELLRSEANFLLAPIMLAVALSLGGGTVSARGLHDAALYTLLLALALTALGIAIFLAGAPGLQKPALDAWLKEDKPAWTSPELLAPLRGRHPEQQNRRRSGMRTQRLR